MANHLNHKVGLKIKTNISEVSEESKDEPRSYDKVFTTRNSFEFHSPDKKAVKGQSQMLRTFFMIDKTDTGHSKRPSCVDIQIEPNTAIH